MCRFSEENLFKMTKLIFLKAGAPEGRAEIVAKSLIDTNLMGIDSHGIAMIYRYLELIDLGWLDPNADIEVEMENTGSCLINGNWCFGQVVCSNAMDMAISKAKDTGIAYASVYNSSHCGRLGQYSEQAAMNGMIGITMINNHGAGRMVAPFGGTQRRLSTNPLSIAIPYKDKRPFLLDMTTSVVAERKIKLKHLSNERTPEGWFITEDGRLSTDPEEFYSDPPGALQAFGGAVGYKGYGLSLAVDILAGAISSAGCSNPISKKVGNSFLGIVINPNNSSQLADSVNGLLEYVKSSKKAPGIDEILYPGELEQRTFAERKQKGITVPKDIKELLQKALKKLDIEDVFLMDSNLIRNIKD